MAYANEYVAAGNQSIFMKGRIFSQLAIAALVLSAACTDVKADDPNVVALFGDSTSLGVNQNFPNGDGKFGGGKLDFNPPSTELTKVMNDSRRKSVVPNLGWGGTASGPAISRGNRNINGVDRIRDHLSAVKRDNPGKAYYALIMYGVNDWRFDIEYKVTAYNIGLMIDRANAQGFTAVVSSITPCDACRGPNFINMVNSRIRDVVKDRIGAGADVYYVDNYSALRPRWNPTLPNSYVESDLLHPTDLGYKVIAQNWFNSQLEQLIEQDPVPITPVIGLLLSD